MLTVQIDNNGDMQSTSTRWFIRSAMLFVVLAAAVGWIAMGNIGGASADGLRSTDAALGHAVELADTSATLAAELQNAVTALSTGMNSSAEAIDHTIELSKTVRGLLDSVSVLGVPGFAGADAFSATLQQVEESLLEVQGGVAETFKNLQAAVPNVAKTVTTLQALPDQLRAAQTAIRTTTDDIDRGVVLSRVALILGAVALLLIFVVADRIVRSMSVGARPVGAQPATAQPATAQP